jgi:hypothetical protein
MLRAAGKKFLEIISLMGYRKYFFCGTLLV